MRIFERIDQITKLPETDVELIMILDEIQSTSLYKTLPFYMKIISFKSEEILLASYLEKEFRNYYHLFFRLREYMKSNNISITIEGVR